MRLFEHPIYAIAFVSLFHRAMQCNRELTHAIKFLIVFEVHRLTFLKRKTVSFYDLSSICGTTNLSKRSPYDPHTLCIVRVVFAGAVSRRLKCNLLLIENENATACCNKAYMCTMSDYYQHHR